MTSGRAIRFAAVGAAGLIVQLGAIWLLHDGFGLHYELAAFVATELAIVHNFVWHARWTWADREASIDGTGRRLLRFHVSSGAISLIGALLLMPVLVDDAHLNVLLADVLVVVSCAAANFVAIDRAVFRHCAVIVLCALGWSGSIAVIDAADLGERAAAAFDRYARLVEQRLDREKQGELPFLLLDHLSAAARRDAYAALDRGDVVAARVESRDSPGAPDVPGGLCHHWAGTIFIPGVTIDRVIGLMQSYDRYQEIYAPHIRRSAVIDRHGSHFRVFLQLSIQRVVSVVLNTDNDVRYVRISPTRAQVRSVSTRIAEVDSPESPDAREKAVGHDNGFLWRFNNYCALEERPLHDREPGTFVQCESLSLSRAIPLGLDWLVGPFVSSVPRESLEFTLGAMRTALTSTRFPSPLKLQSDER